MLLAHMDQFGEISVYHVGGGDIAYSFGPGDNDETEEAMSHQGFATGDCGFYLASAHGQDIHLWQLGSNRPTLKGIISSHRSRVVKVRGACVSARNCRCSDAFVFSHTARVWHVRLVHGTT